MESEPLVALYDDLAQPFADFTAAWQKPRPIELVTPYEPDESGHAFSPNVEDFLANLRREQVRFLDAVSVARMNLQDEPGQLSGAAVLQGRLTQRFLDAQRSILRGRAEADAKIARIADDTERRIAGTVAVPDGFAGGDHQVNRVNVVVIRDQTERRAESETSLDSDSLARVIDAAFEVNQPEGAQGERQLRALLDEWWRSELQECKAAVDDAYARAAMRLHMATAQAGNVLMAAVSDSEIAATPRFDPPVAPPVATFAPLASVFAPPEASRESPPEPDKSLMLLPPSLLVELDSVDHKGLDSLIESLLDALEERPSQELPPAALSAVAAIESDEWPSHLVPDRSSDDFWSRRSGPWPVRLARHWVIAHVLFPMVTVVGALAVVLAVTG